MNAPSGVPVSPQLKSAESILRQSLIAARRFDCISLSRAEFASLPPDAQEEYCRQVRAAHPELYEESQADMVRRWRSIDRNAQDRDYQSDHHLALLEGEREMGEPL